MVLKSIEGYKQDGSFDKINSFAPPSLYAAEFQDGVDMKYFLTENEYGEIVVEDLVNGEVELTAVDTDITYSYFSKNNANRGTDIKSNNINALKSTDFTANKETVFIIHGWKNDDVSDVNIKIRSAILPSHDVNVFVVNWGPVAGKTYITAQGSVVAVGRFVASFIKSLEDQFKLNLNKVKLVGHSLGAHVAGNAGADLGSRVDTIVGLDPAWPLFSVKRTDNRLDPTDAKLVHVIHTNGGKLGFTESCGHVDFFPNGGKNQPGCVVDVTGSCSHSRAYMYYAESLSSGRFIAKHCSSLKDFTDGKCDSAATAVMGNLDVDTRSSGTYYLATNSASPFARG